MEPTKPNSKREFMIEDRPLSAVEKGTPPVEEARFNRKYILAAFIEHTCNLLFVVTLGGYIYMMFGALTYYKLLYAVLAILFMSPYFIVMLQALPLLKGFYKERYAT